MTPYPRKSKPVALCLALANWIIPGLGYFLVKDNRKAIGLFLIINGIFLLGLFAYDAYIYIPSFVPRTPEFNIVAILTLLAQLCHGVGTVGLILLEKASGGEFNLLVRDPGQTYSDIGSFHLLVAGVLNYFACMKLYDDLTGWVDPEEEEKKRKKKSSEKENNNDDVKITDKSSEKGNV